jgi:hypothetical protein
VVLDETVTKERGEEAVKVFEIVASNFVSKYIKRIHLIKTFFICTEKLKCH